MAKEKRQYKHPLITFRATIAEKAALERFCKQHQLSKSEVIRKGLQAIIEDFPDDMPAQGENLKGSDNYHKQ